MESQPTLTVINGGRTSASVRPVRTSSSHRDYAKWQAEFEAGRQERIAKWRNTLAQSPSGTIRSKNPRYQSTVLTIAALPIGIMVGLFAAQGLTEFSQRVARTAMKPGRGFSIERLGEVLPFPSLGLGRTLK